MKAIISSTYDNQYIFFLPITSWCWQKLGVSTICFLPLPEESEERKVKLVAEYAKIKAVYFDAPEHKKATYAQCARLFGGSLGLDDDEQLIVSDIDMLVFNHPFKNWDVDKINILGRDLTPTSQYPMCYCLGTKKVWKEVMNVGDRNHQTCLDDLLYEIEAEHFRGNFWSKDQEELFNNVSKTNPILIDRARPGTQFARNRIDRDDAYFMERLSPDIIDYHCHRPGYLDENFEKIMAVIKYFYPHDDISWMHEYQRRFKELL